MDRNVTRHDDGSSSWPCRDCKKIVWRFPGTSSASCGNCGAQYSIFGQPFRRNWRDNPSNYDSDIGDMEGYEIEMSGDY